MSWGLAVVLGIPTVVGVLAIVWPERGARGESVYDIRERVEREREQGGQAYYPVRDR